jgi:hypothetical protein
MKKSAQLLITLILFCLLFLVSAYSQEDMRFVNTDAFENPQRPPALFNHDSHNELAEIEQCNECHHIYDDDGNLLEDESSEDQACADCHQLNTQGKKPALMKAYHTNCKGCHLKQNKGPVMCGQCHVRNPVIEE